MNLSQDLLLHIDAIDQWLMATVDGDDPSVSDLGEAWSQMVDAKKRLDGLISAIEAEILTHMDGREVQIRNTVYERRKSTAKTVWDHPLAAHAVAREALDRRKPDEDGVVEREADCVVSAILSVAGVTYWKKAGLEQLGLDVADYRTREPGRERLVPKRPVEAERGLRPTDPQASDSD